MGRRIRRAEVTDGAVTHAVLKESEGRAATSALHQLATPKMRAEHLQRIERQISTADGVITDLNDFIRLPIPLLERISIEQCWRDVLKNTPLPQVVEVRIDVQ